jgi:hypothetical protein
MLTPPKDKRVHEALNRLQYHEDWRTVRGWLEEGLRAQSEANDAQRDDVTLRQGQGCALTLRALLRFQDESEETLHKMKR